MTITVVRAACAGVLLTALAGCQVPPPGAPQTHARRHCDRITGSHLCQDEDTNAGVMGGAGDPAMQSAKHFSTGGQ